MKPAWSVVLLTTLLGAAQGLFLATYGVDLYSAVRGVESPAPWFIALSACISIGLAGAGLAASFFHLGRPERAWRSAAMWRTSWLSREVIALPLFIALVAAYGALHWLGMHPAALAAGAAAALACVALFVCTGMIYASIKFLQEWHSPLTVLNFILLGLSSGLTLITALAARFDPGAARAHALAALAVLALAALSRGATLVRNARLRPVSNLQTAIGIKHPRIAQKAQGAMGGSFNTREFFHGMPVGRLQTLRWLAAGGAFAAPALLLALQWPLAAFLLQFAGLVAERWHFFAEARHPQNLYYQSVS